MKALEPWNPSKQIYEHDAEALPGYCFSGLTPFEPFSVFLDISADLASKDMN